MAGQVFIPPGQEKNYDAGGRWIGAGREPFELWLMRIKVQQKTMGLTDEQVDESTRYAVEIPGVSEIIHVIPRAKISPEEMKAHKAALRRGEASPLSARQLETLAWKKEVFYRISKSPTPEVARKAGWYLNQIENVGDMMTAAYWGGKGILWALGKLGVKTRGPASKYVGWALLAKDITDVVNLFKLSRAARPAKKGEALKSTSMNPFSKESKLTRAFKLKAKLPGIPDWLEIAQTTDDWFGIGISFGPVVGFVQDLMYGVNRGARVNLPGGAVKDLTHT